jgi:hypothetical protein
MEHSQHNSSQIISYTELVTREQQNLQRGMNYRTGARQSVFLMSTRPGAPYKDAWHETENLLVYEGHDLNSKEAKNGKKGVDQPLFERTGVLTDNGKFFKAAQDYRLGRRKPLLIQVYEKVADGIWYDKGCFQLLDAIFEKDGPRNVFKFYLRPSTNQTRAETPTEYQHERMIPSAVKVVVWKRDRGKCVKCATRTGLHYDHIIPFSRGGRSDDERNIQLLCARHNLEKRDNIE